MSCPPSLAIINLVCPDLFFFFSFFPSHFFSGILGQCGRSSLTLMLFDVPFQLPMLFSPFSLSPVHTAYLLPLSLPHTHTHTHTPSAFEPTHLNQDNLTLCEHS